ncbi:hypothetical protein Pve01_74230 [Planomonospora venezuelensis]|nr:hypothetical protein Pve01_74230 [Planomonospora venezuelensis]
MIKESLDHTHISITADAYVRHCIQRDTIEHMGDALGKTEP